jgi:hypothetical protein
MYTLPKLDYLRRQKTRAEIWHLCVFSYMCYRILFEKYTDPGNAHNDGL